MLGVSCFKLLNYLFESFYFVSILPAPSQPVWDRDDERRKQKLVRDSTVLVIAQPVAPPYGERKGWIPRHSTDFGGLLVFVNLYNFIIIIEILKFKLFIIKNVLNKNRYGPILFHLEKKISRIISVILVQ